MLRSAFPEIGHFLHKNLKFRGLAHFCGKTTHSVAQLKVCELQNTMIRNHHHPSLQLNREMTQTSNK